MKKLFTFMGLAAWGLLAGSPLFAQQQTLTSQQAETVLKSVFPAVMNQVKLASGLDVQQLAAGNEGWSYDARIPAITVQPDSACINVKALIHLNQDEDDPEFRGAMPDEIIDMLGLANLKITFSNHQKIQFGRGGMNAEIQLPGKTAIDLLMPESIQLLIEAEQTTDPVATMPFKKLVLKSEINPMFAAFQEMMPEAFRPLMQSGTLLTLTQSSSNGINTVTTELGDGLLALVQLMNKEDEEDDEVDEVVFKKISTITDRTTLEKKGFYTVTKKGYLNNSTEQMIEEQIVYGPAQLMPLIADSIITKEYDTDGSLSDITKRTFRLSSKGGSNGNTITQVTTDSILYVSESSPWLEVEKDSTIMEGNRLPLDPNHITMSFIQSVIADMAQVNQVPTNSFQKITYLQDNEEDGYEADNMIYMNMLKHPAATTAEKDTLCSMVVLADANEDGVSFTSHTGIEIDLVKDQAIISVQKIGLDENTGITRTKIATLYAKSNFLEITTDNEEIAAPQSDVTFGIEANGIYVNNCRKGSYMLIGMNGRVLGNGVIAGEGAYIPTSQLTRGGIYIIAVKDERGLTKAMTFAK